MSLAAALRQCRTEEDVKDAYIAALGLKGVRKGLVDIQTDEIWFEAKAGATPAILMFAQLLFYIRAARRRGEAIPAFLAVIDREKATISPIRAAIATSGRSITARPRRSIAIICLNAATACFRSTNRSSRAPITPRCTSSTKL